MDGSTVSDFSIERILSPQLGLRPQPVLPSPDRYLQGVRLERLPAPGPGPGCLQHGGMMLYPRGAAFHGADFRSFYQNSGVLVRFSSQEPAADAQPLPGYPVHPQARHRTRMRTVFTDSQSKQLEALFELTDYPPPETRAEVARSTGLSEETVRVWFKNRRARRKRQRQGSKVKSPSSSPCSGAEKRLFNSVL